MDFAQTLLQISLENKDTGFEGWSGGSGVIVVTLLLMVGAMVAMYVFFKRFGMIKDGGKGQLKVVETRPLGGRQFLVVGKYGKQTFLLGVCPGKIDYLCPLDDEDPEPFPSLKIDMGEEESK